MFGTFDNDQKGDWSDMLPQRVIQVTLVKGTTSKKTGDKFHTDIIGDTFWNEHGDILNS